MPFNSKGYYKTTLKNYMRAYDKLPPNVRKALANAQFNWAPQQCLTALRRGKITPAQLAAAVIVWDAKHRAKTRVKTWGRDYPT